MRLVTPEQMREMDRLTIQDIGLPGLVLMERAALGATNLLIEHFAPNPGDPVGVLCGPGNNGGDGIAMARMLANRGFQPTIFLLGAPRQLSPDASRQLGAARALGLDVVDLSDLTPDRVSEGLSARSDVSIWVDALLGTGITRPLAGRWARAVEFLNARDSVLAVDIPSGVDGESGQILGVAVDAHATATFGMAKLGQTIDPGRSCCGQLHVVDIGIPPRVAASVGFIARRIDDAWCRQHLQPRQSMAHKGSSGKLLLLAGSHEKTGAALLATRGALLSGAGLLTVGTRADVVERVAPVAHEAMAAHLIAHPPDPRILQRLDDLLERVDAVGIGPGMGLDEGAQETLSAVLNSSVLAAVFDADALTMLAALPNLSAVAALAHRAVVVLTPHPGEMARLCQTSIDDVLRAPAKIARDLASRTGAFVVLKLSTTLIAAPDGRLAVNASGNPGMATGGMGDILTGMIGARLAEASEPAFDAIALAVFAHGHAADLAAHHTGHRGLNAAALLQALPSTWRSFET